MGDVMPVKYACAMKTRLLLNFDGNRCTVATSLPYIVGAFTIKFCKMLSSAFLISLTAVAAFDCKTSRASSSSLRMGLDPALKSFPRDFKKIPIGTEYGTGTDEVSNKAVEARRLAYLEEDLFSVLKEAVATKERPMFTTALIAGDAVILDALHKTGLLSKVPIVFVDTFTLFPETLQYLHEVENHYGFKSIIYNAADCKDQEDYYSKFGRDYWMKDIDQYDMLCKVRSRSNSYSCSC